MHRDLEVHARDRGEVPIAVAPAAKGDQHPQMRISVLRLVALAAPFVVVVGGRSTANALCGEADCPPTARSFEEDSAVLSPPIVTAVSADCGVWVNVAGHVPGAAITVVVNGNDVVTVLAPEPTASIELPTPLEPMDVVEAYQTLGTVDSGLSDPVSVVGQTWPFTSNRMSPTPLYECARWVGSVGQPLGSRVEYLADGTSTIADYRATTAPHAVAGIDPLAASEVQPRYFLCDGPEDEVPPGWPQTDSPLEEPGEPVHTVTPPVPFIVDGHLSATGHYEIALTEGATVVNAGNVVPGAMLRVYDAASGALLGEGIDWYNHGFASVRLFAPLSVGRAVTVTQELCEETAHSDPVVASACDDAAGPLIVDPVPGDREVHVTQSVSGARVRVYANGDEIGDGSGPILRLTRAIEPGDVIDVVQEIGGDEPCITQYSNHFEVDCTQTRALSLPHVFNRWDANVDIQDYSASAISVGGRTVRVSGTVAFPTDGEGNVTPGAGRLPLVLIMHGAHETFFWDGEVESNPECNGAAPLAGNITCCAAAPVPSSENEVESFRGYDYLLESLAGAGAIVASINANDLNCTPSGQDFFDAGVDLFRAHIDVLAETFDPIIDVDQTILVGHSRGADRALRAAQVINTPSNLGTVIGTVAIAPPWNSRRTSLLSVSNPTLILYGGLDGDVSPVEDWNGSIPASTPILYGGPIRLYDQMNAYAPVSMMFFDRANHGHFNSVWGSDPNALILSGHMTAAQQRAQTRDAVLGWVRWLALGDSQYRAAFTGDRLIGAPAYPVRVSYKDAFDAVFDDFENGDPFQTSSSQAVEPNFSSYSEQSLDTDDGPNTTYAHQTSGAHFVTGSSGGSLWLQGPDPGGMVAGYHVLAFRAARSATPMGPQPSSGLQFGVGIVYDDYAGGASTFVDASRVGTVQAPSDLGSRELTVLETVRIPLACFDVVPGDAVTTITFSIDPSQSGAIDHVVLQAR